MPDKKAIQALGLHKDFGEVYAVKDVSFDVNEGEIFSLLGPNGAGKSTTISMLACLLKPTLGDALVMGNSILSEVMAVKAAIGVVPMIVMKDPLWAPLASVFAFGIVVSMILTLLVIPALYGLIIKEKKSIGD